MARHKRELASAGVRRDNVASYHQGIRDESRATFAKEVRAAVEKKGVRAAEDSLNLQVHLHL